MPELFYRLTKIYILKTWCHKVNLHQYIYNRPISIMVRVMARDTGVQSWVESYQRLKKWYLMLPCLTLSILRCKSRLKWGNTGKEVAPSPTTSWCSSYRKGKPSGHPRLRSPFDLLYLYIYIYI